MVRRRLLPAALGCVLAVAVAAASAQAAEVTVVDGDRAVRRHDPLVPTPVQPEPAAPTARIAGRSIRSARRARSATTRRGRLALLRTLRRTVAAGRVSRGAYVGYVRTYNSALRTLRRLRGARARQLGYVVVAIEGMALRRQAIPSRLPLLFLTLRRNVQYWPSLRFPRSRDQLTFRGSEVLFQYYPGRGLQVQPLSTFKKANLMFGACNGTAAGPCRRDGLARLLDEMNGLAVQRSPGFIAWEYVFGFGGGPPPWMSGMAQATGIQALGRASQLLGRPDYLATARRALGAFETPPPAGVRVTGPGGGVHYLQYSFAPRLYIFNAFLQSIIGLYDYDQIAHDPRVTALWQAAEPEARREVPLSDLGDWSRYRHGGPRASAEYHELLREFLQGLCNRLRTEPYCGYASRYRRYQERRYGGA